MKKKDLKEIARTILYDYERGNVIAFLELQEDIRADILNYLNDRNRKQRSSEVVDEIVKIIERNQKDEKETDDSGK